MAIPRIDPEEQISQMHGAADLVRHLGRGALSTVAGGLAGLGNFPRGADAMEAARQAVTEGLAPGDISPEGIKTIQDKVAPIYHAVMDNTGPTVRVGGRDLETPTLGQNMDSLANKYHQGLEQDTGLVGKYLGPEAAGMVGAVGEAAPNALFPEAGAERAVAGRLPAGAGEMMHLGHERLLEDGANASTLAREAAARRRMAEEGIEPQPYAEPFQGRQAAHEGAVALRQQPATAFQMEPANEAHAPWAPAAEYPEGAMAFTARDPETGELLGRQVVAKRGNMMQSVRMDTRPDMQGQGIGTNLFQRAINHAHENGLDFASDTQVSVPAMKTYLKHPGESYLNPAHEEINDPVDGPVIRSSNGQPIVSFPRPQETEPGQYIASQAHAKGGRIGTISEIGKLVDRFAPLVKSIEDTGGVTYHPGTGEQPKSGYAVSIHKGREAILPSAPDAHELARYAHANQDLFSADPAAHVGIWHDPESGKHFMDVSHVDPDFNSALKKAQEHQQLGIYDLAHGQTIDTTPETMHFLHMSNLSSPTATLDPKFYGTGIKGAEARRGGTKTTSLYPWDIDPTQIEQGLESKTPYRVSVPKSSMYDISADPQGLRGGAPNFSEAEDSIKDAGYAGYHVPEGEGIFRGQARLFHPTPATRLGPDPGGLRPGELEDFLEQMKNPTTSTGGTAVPQTNVSDIFSRGRSAPKKPAWQPFDDTTDTSGFAEGGEVGNALGGLGALVRRYAPEAEHLAGQVATHGGVTYNPTSGELHTTGYAVPTHPARSVALDAPPTPDDLHDFMMTHQDAFDENPQASLHVHGDENGNSYLHIAHVTPDFEHASDVARQHGIPGFQDLGTGDIHGASTTAPRDVPETTQPDADLVEKYLSESPRSHVPWTSGQQTVANPKRNAFPGVYGDPRKVVSDATEKVGPENPLLQQLFGVSRSDLSDLALSRQGNELGNLPSAKQNPTGSAAARDVMTPANEQRLIDMMSEARKSPELFKGMTGWYTMDPLYERFRQLYGDEEAPSRYAHFNTMVGMASPGSDVGTEIARGTGAHWLNNEGRFNDFLKYAGGMGGDAPADMADLPGHVYHKTAQGLPMKDYLETGQVQMKSPKVPMYIAASGVPETGFQTETPVGDAHWARGVGLADTRGTRTSKGTEIVPGSSVSTPEMQTLAPWWRNRVAAPAGLESVPAQALAWGAYSPYTGVKSEIGAPKLEILSTQIGKLAARLGVSPETARDMVITGKAGAFSEGGVVDDVLAAGGI